ncbi:MAG: hypothetical protein ACD_45C00233G0001 [uncultured bacterium]|nr:MAG: hypothetical protein ACD_45C00233G0001 [uncultured bacterium]
MSKIQVHVLEFFECKSIHVEIVLKEETDNGAMYYNINRWASPIRRAQKDCEPYLNLIKEANKDLVFEIDENMDDIIEKWNQKYFSENANLCCNNCADTTAWFLETFVNIPNPGNCSKPIACNYVYCGFFSPSFLQCCTVPGRIMNYAEKAIQQRQREISPLIPSSPSKVSMA